MRKNDRKEYDVAVLNECYDIKISRNILPVYRVISVISVISI